MTTVKQFFLDILGLDFNLGICVYLLVWTEILGRIGMSAAFGFKKNKSRLKKEAAQRSLVYKILCLYHLPQSKAPHHMKKYALIRICNPISFILDITIYLCIPYAPKLRLIFSVLILLHALFLLGPPIIDPIVLSNTKRYGKMPDFDRSKKP